MSLCINPRCLQPDHPGNDGNRFCQSCGSDLVLQGRYRVMRLLSDKSGFGKVYEAFERSVPKLLKVLKESHTHHPKAIELFQQEAIVLSQLQHPGIPSIEPNGYFQFHPRNSAEGLHCILMEKVDGLNLREWMQQQGNYPISEQQALNWLNQIAEILHLVHSKNFFHRDIKPENIMLRSTGQLVLVDFGAAREMTYTYLAQLGGTGGVTRISSAGYTPPEQEKGQAVPQSDFYALGCTFIYLLTGKQPTDQTIYNSLNNSFDWRPLAPQISPQLANFIDKLVAQRASERPKNTQELLAILAQLQAEVSPIRLIPPFQTSPPHPSGQGTGRSQFVTSVIQSGPTVLQGLSVSKTWLLAGLGALLLGVGGYGSWQIYRAYALRGSPYQAIAITQTYSGHTSYINDLVVSPDGKQVISASADRTIKIWDRTSGAEIQTLSGHTSFVNVLAVSPDGTTLVSGSADRTIKIWNLTTGQLQRTLDGNGGFINALAIRTDGALLASGGADGLVNIWDLTTGEKQRSLSGHSGFINALAFTPDGQTLVSGSADHTIKTWDLSTGNIRATLTGHLGYVNDLAISPDGQRLYSASADQTIKVWDLNTGTLLKTLEGHSSFVNAVAISPDGQTLVSGSADQTIKIWNLNIDQVTDQVPDQVTDQVKQTLTGYGSHIDFFVVSPDWQTIMSGSGDTEIKAWQLPR